MQWKKNCVADPSFAWCGWIPTLVFITFYPLYACVLALRLWWKKSVNLYGIKTSTLQAIRLRLLRRTYVQSGSLGATSTSVKQQESARYIITHAVRFSLRPSVETSLSTVSLDSLHVRTRSNYVIIGFTALRGETFYFSLVLLIKNFCSSCLLVGEKKRPPSKQRHVWLLSFSDTTLSRSTYLRTYNTF